MIRDDIEKIVQATTSCYSDKLIEDLELLFLRRLELVCAKLGRALRAAKEMELVMREVPDE